MLDLGADLLARVRAAERGELLSLIRELERARDAALLRLAAAETRLLPVDEAAQLVALPERRLRSLARGKAWAIRIGRTLRVDPEALLAWARDVQGASPARTNKPVPAAAMFTTRAKRHGTDTQAR